MSFLRDILDIRNNAGKDFREFQNLPKEKLAELIPSVILEDKKGILIQDFSRLDTIISEKPGIPFIESLNVNVKLGAKGFYTITLKGVIYNIDTFISSGKFKRLFGLFNKFNLYFGWGKYLSFSESARIKYNSFFSYIPCSLASFKVNYRDYITSTFTMDLVSNIANLEKQVNVEEFGLSFNKQDDFKDYDFKIVSGKDQYQPQISVKKYWMRFGKLIESIVTKINSTSAIDGSGIPIIKPIEVKFEKTETLDTTHFAYGSKYIYDLKIYQDAFKTPNIFKGNIKSVFENIINSCFHESISRKVTFFIDETIDKTIIIFYCLDDEYSLTKAENEKNNVELILNSKNSLIQDIEFDYEKPLYTLNLLKTKREGQTGFGEKDSKALKDLADQYGVDLEKLKESLTGQTLNQIPNNTKSIILGLIENAKSLTNQSLAPEIVRFTNITCSMTTNGFTGFYPGQNLKLLNNLLFEGQYVISEINHDINTNSFKSQLELICLKPSDALISLFKSS